MAKKNRHNTTNKSGKNKEKLLRNSSKSCNGNNNMPYTFHYNKKHLTTIVIAISLIGIVSISGCVGADFFDSIFGKVADFFGMDVIKPSRDVSAVGVVNPIVIDRVWTMPDNKVIPYIPFSI